MSSTRLPPFDRRDFLRGAAGALAASGAALVGCSADPVPPVGGSVMASSPPSGPSGSIDGAPAIVPPDGARPRVPYGVQSGDVTSSSAIVWSKADRLARLVVEWDTDPRFSSPRRVEGPVATAASDFTARVDLSGLPAGQRIHYRVVFEVPGSPAVKSEPARGSFPTALSQAAAGDVLFAWSGDTAGQGWGIDEARGGWIIYEAIRRAKPDFFIHCGDLIYADNPIRPEVMLRDGSTWRNVTTPAKSKVAETLDDFRGNHAYNFLDKNVRRLAAEVPALVMWDDHEVHNNWTPSTVLDDARYTVKECGKLMGPAKQAMFEYTPIRWAEGTERRVYRSFSRGPSLDVFLLDERSYRGPNTENRQPVPGPETAMLGAAQLAWLEASLAASKATWKVIATDQPVGLLVGDKLLRPGVYSHDGWGNGAGPPLGRELELSDLLRFCKQRGVKNLVFLTADVHYAAAHHFDPARGEVHDFDPFWEFVAGPLSASTYGPNPLDPTFGPEVRYRSPSASRSLQGPADGGQYFGTVKIDGKTEVMTVTLLDLHGTKLHSVDLTPVRA